MTRPGCPFCRDPQNRGHGHLAELARDEAGTALLRCPHCRALWVDDPLRPFHDLVLTETEAGPRYPARVRFDGVPRPRTRVAPLAGT